MKAAPEISKDPNSKRLRQNTTNVVINVKMFVKANGIWGIKEKS